MNESILESQYRTMLTSYDRLREEVTYILRQAIQQERIKIHLINSRTKIIESIIDKAQRKNLENPLEELNDIVGVRIICLFRSDIEQLGRIIRSSFIVKIEDNKLESYNVESFGYLSVHFIACLPSKCSGPRYEGLHKIPFEIQIRTLAMDAWATISHYLDYKTEEDVPKELRKDFFALSGLFYLSDTHFELFYEAKLKARAQALDILLKRDTSLDQDLNLDSLIAYLFDRFPKREHNSPKDGSALVSELRSLGYSSISQLENTVSNVLDAFLEFEKQFPPANAVQYSDIGLIRGILSISDDRFIDLNNESEKWRKRYCSFRKLIKH